MLHNHNSLTGNAKARDYAKFTVALGHASIERKNEYGYITIAVRDLPDSSDSGVVEIMSRLDLIPSSWINNRNRHNVMVYGLGLQCDCQDCTKEVYITSRQLMGLRYQTR